MDDVLAVATTPYETKMAKYTSSYLRRIFDHVHEHTKRLGVMKESNDMTFKTVLDIDKVVQVRPIVYPCFL